ncbi:sensor histidine kinase [Solicola sp. PLA-1-18]|uniref:sensor histidine kinase n=1 Tax=Solicola sp. PLA-1-18 TaxID=3380532 RepID=UPI003B7B3CE0
MANELGVILVGLLGALLGAGAVFLFRLSEREQRREPERPAPDVPAGVESVLGVLRSSAVLVGPDDSVLKASAPAYAIGMVREDRLDSDELMELVRLVRRDGQVRTTELSVLSPRSSQPLALSARVAPLSSRLMLVLVEDRTRERRVESIRRDFVANVSHELKTPVGALNLLAEAVSEASDDPEAVVRFAGRMRGESERLTRLVQQIIDLSRLQGDQLVDEPVEIDVAATVCAAVEASLTEADAKDIAVATSCESDLWVLGDPDQVLAAISNLVENAVTYSPEGSKVAVTASREGDDVAISVADQGIGIPHSEIGRIFERFYRVDPARARATGGTGLGLSIVKHVAASHGGSVRVWSEPGAGSSFTITLPVHAPESFDVDVTDATTGAGSSGAHLLSPKEARQ